jgi:N-carbamoylputrescine amidase
VTGPARELLTAYDIPASPARTEPATREPIRVALVQERWHADPREHRDRLTSAVLLAAREGARLVCLPELTLSPYFAVSSAGPDAQGIEPEELPGGPTHTFAAEAAAESGAFVHASLYERGAGTGGEELGYNTAIVVAPGGALVARTRKVHLPVTEGYFEDRYFRPGDTGFPTVEFAGARFGFPTCWDQWFPEVARAYSLQGAEVLVYPTAIGSEPDHPAFDTEPLWEQVIRAHGITNGTFMVVPNRVGTEGPITFYGSSFISDPYGRVLVQAPRDRPAILVADLDLDQRRDWLALFPLLATRRPETYGLLTTPTDGSAR